MGASVALEMIASGRFTGPVVLLGVSLSAEDEPAFFRAIVRLGERAGQPARPPSWPRERPRWSSASRCPRHVRTSCAKTSARTFPEHARLGAPRIRTLAASARTSRRAAVSGGRPDVDRPRRRRVTAGSPPTSAARLKAAPHAHLVTIPGAVFFLPNEIPKRIADIIVEAAACSSPKPASRAYV